MKIRDIKIDLSELDDEMEVSDMWISTEKSGEQFLVIISDDLYVKPRRRK